MIFPFFQKSFLNLPFVFHVYNVNYNWLFLQETIASVNCLYKIIKFKINTKKDFSMTVFLKITTRS